MLGSRWWQICASLLDLFVYSYTSVLVIQIFVHEFECRIMNLMYDKNSSFSIAGANSAQKGVSELLHMLTGTHLFFLCHSFWVWTHQTFKYEKVKAEEKVFDWSFHFVLMRLDAYINLLENTLMLTRKIIISSKFHPLNNVCGPGG